MTARLEHLTGAEFGVKVAAAKPVAHAVFNLAKSAGREAAATGAALAAVTIWRASGVDREHAVLFVRQLWALVEGAQSGDADGAALRFQWENGR